MKDKSVSKSTDEFLQLMSKYYGVDQTVYALCGLTFQIIKTSIPESLISEKSAEVVEKETTELAQV